ncbi:DgyrCDS3962 [Dimorphilus gyrociliatus]|uniref:DgyrCDS3962 n=1 Tax=Dimorphilus gyrociliatus TaxID=2664684 RepID=A0A7I8VGV8_9ANNE|nr:DgyrCDS3962 [Dimorphilus gyrociliatus]
MKTVSVQLDNKTKVQWNLKPFQVGNEHKNVKIQARSSVVYNPCLPTRAAVREENYLRRRRQMTEQGFRSVNHKPYKGIGDPFYLDYDKLVLLALGQWDPNDEGQYEAEEDTESEHEKPTVKRKQMNAANFVLRSRKNLNNLRKEQARIRIVEQNVRFGHSLFEIMEKEEERKRIEQEIREREEKAKACKPIDSDEEKEESEESVNSLIGYVAKYEPSRRYTETPNTDITDSLIPIETTRTETRQSTADIRSLSRNLRPYAPSASLVTADAKGLPPREDFYRQLCVLNWILDAMSVDTSQTPHQHIERVSSAFSSGRSTTSGRKRDQSRSESQWSDFASSKKVTTIQRPTLNTRQSLIRRRHSNLTVPSSSRSSSPSANQASSSPKLEDVSEDDEKSANVNDNQHKAKENESNNKIPEESKVKDKIIQGVEEPTKEEDNTTKPKRKQQTVGKRKAQISEEHMQIYKHLEVLQREERDPRLAKLTHAEDRRREVMIRASENIRPQSSPAVLEYASSLPSWKKGAVPSEMRNKFAEVGQTQALLLHEAFEARENNRNKQMLHKFRRLSTSQLHFHNAVRNMRSGRRSPRSSKHSISQKNENYDYSKELTLDSDTEAMGNSLSFRSATDDWRRSAIWKQKKREIAHGLRKLKIEQAKEAEKRDKSSGRFKYYDWYIDLNIQCFEYDEYLNCPLIMAQLRELEKFGKVSNTIFTKIIKAVFTYIFRPIYK